MSTLLDHSKTPAIPVLIDQFLKRLKVENDASDYTIVNYEIDLRRWVKFLSNRLKSKLGVKAFTNLADIRAFLAEENEHYSRTTVCRRLSVMKSFLKFLHREGYLEQNTARLISIPRGPQKLPRVLKPEEVLALIKAVPGITLREKRIRAMIELFYSAGLRLSE